MKKLLLIFMIIPQFYLSQENSNQLTLGINVGGYSANKNTAGLYKGDVTTYNIFTIFNNPNYKPVFDNYFQYPYEIVETPLNSKYRVGLEIGGHIGIKNEFGELFAEINFADISVQEFFIVAVDDPNNLSPDPTYEPIPLFGEEQRTNINVGYSYDLYNEDGITVSFPFFAQITNARLQKNYFVINNQQYNIFHGVAGQTNTNPRGTSFGGGAGLTGAIKFNDQFSFLVGYYAQYSKIKLREDLQPFGLHHSIFARIIWSK